MRWMGVVRGSGGVQSACILAQRVREMPATNAGSRTMGSQREALMQPFLRWLVVAAVVALLELTNGAAAQEPVKQIKLTASQVEAYIAVQPDIVPILKKILFNEASGDDPKVVAELDSAFKKHGFRDSSEYGDVLKNIVLVINRIDPQTKAVKDTRAEIARQIAETRADKTMATKARKEAVRDLNEALKREQPIQHQGNVDLVVKYYEKIQATF
jgi:hypothetical protein